MKKHIDFIRWVKKCGGDIRKTKLALYAQDYRGLHATTEINSGDVIMSIPVSLAVTSARLEVTEIGKILTEKKAFTGKWPSYLFPLIYMLDELKKTDSEHKAWLDVIPKKANGHPAFFGEDEKKWLQGSCTLGILHH